MRALSVAIMVCVAASLANAAGWRFYHNRSFSVKVPSTFRDAYPFRDVQGRPPVELFGTFFGDGMILNFTAGRLKSPFGSWPPSATFKDISVDRHDSRVGTMKRIERGKGYPFVTTIHIVGQNGEFDIIGEASCLTMEEVDLAQKIFKTIRSNPRHGDL